MSQGTDNNIIVVYDDDDEQPAMPVIHVESSRDCFTTFILLECH